MNFKNLIQYFGMVPLLSSISRAQISSHSNYIDTKLKLQQQRLNANSDWAAYHAECGSEIIKNIFVTTDDGVKLEAVVSYSTDLKTAQRVPGKFPVINERTPYVRLAQRVNPITYFSERGYTSIDAQALGWKRSGRFNNQKLLS